MHTLGFNINLTNTYLEPTMCQAPFQVFTFTESSSQPPRDGHYDYPRFTDEGLKHIEVK